MATPESEIAQLAFEWSMEKLEKVLAKKAKGSSSQSLLVAWAIKNPVITMAKVLPVRYVAEIRDLRPIGKLKGQPEASWELNHRAEMTQALRSTLELGSPVHEVLEKSPFRLLSTGGHHLDGPSTWLFNDGIMAICVNGCKAKKTTLAVAKLVAHKMNEFLRIVLKKCESRGFKTSTAHVLEIAKEIK